MFFVLKLFFFPSFLKGKTEAEKQDSENKLLATTSYQTFDVYYHVDPTLIGGMVIRVGDRVVDSSIRTKLEDMKKQLLNIQLG